MRVWLLSSPLATAASPLAALVHTCALAFCSLRALRGMEGAGRGSMRGVGACMRVCLATPPCAVLRIEGACACVASWGAARLVACVCVRPWHFGWCFVLSVLQGLRCVLQGLRCLMVVVAYCACAKLRPHEPRAAC